MFGLTVCLFCVSMCTINVLICRNNSTYPLFLSSLERCTMSYDFIKVFKKPGESLGIGFNKNSERQNRVYAILEGTALQRSGQVRAGDLIVEVNGTDVSGYTSSQLIDVISGLQDKNEVSLKASAHTHTHQYIIT